MEHKYLRLCVPVTPGRSAFHNRMFSAPVGGTGINSRGYWGRRAALDFTRR